MSINGYYYGQVHGLLGSMNQEPKFDLKLPTGEVNLNYDKNNKEKKNKHLIYTYNFKFGFHVSYPMTWHHFYWRTEKQEILNRLTLIYYKPMIHNVPACSLENLL